MNEERIQNAYKEYLAKLDSSNYKNDDSFTINHEFQEVIRQLSEAGLNDIASIADLDRQVFAVRKSFDYHDSEEKGTVKGLSWMTQGFQTLEDGSTIPLYWPDVRSYQQADYDFFEERYKACKNLYAKTEYGLMVYFGQKTDYSKRNQFKSQLCNELIALANSYYCEAEKGKVTTLRYILSIIVFAFKIASNNKLMDELKNVVSIMFKIQQNWNPGETNNSNIPLRFSHFMLENYAVFKKYIDFSKVISRNEIIIKQIEQNNPYNASDGLILNDRIRQKEGLSIDASLRQRAQLYEKIAEQRKRDMSSIHFIELAIQIYRQLKDETKIIELERLYADVRETIPLNEVKVEIPQKIIKIAKENIAQIVKSHDAEGILHEFINSPWYAKDDDIKSLINAENESLMDMLPLSVIDNRGNIIKAYSPEEGRFWIKYGFYFKFGTMQMLILFASAINAGKLSYATTVAYLEKTWLNEPIERKDNRSKITIIPLDTIKPGLKRIFDEYQKSKENEHYIPDLVTIIDSLTLKIEGILRFFIERLGIPTCAERRSNNKAIMMEKLFDDIIADLKDNEKRPTGFIEDHRTLIKYVMSEKVGWNLRNEVAHSLLQITDYTGEKVVVLFCLILKISGYKFKENEQETDNEI